RPVVLDNEDAERRPAKAGALDAEEVRPGDVDLLDAPVVVEGHQGYRCEVGEVRIPAARGLELDLGIPQLRLLRAQLLPVRLQLVPYGRDPVGRQPPSPNRCRPASTFMHAPTTLPGGPGTRDVGVHYLPG